MEKALILKKMKDRLLTLELNYPNFKKDRIIWLKNKIKELKDKAND